MNTYQKVCFASKILLSYTIWNSIIFLSMIRISNNMYSDTHNMTTGCPNEDNNCKLQFQIICYGDLHMCGFVSIFFSLSFISLVFFIFLIGYCTIEFYQEYKHIDSAIPYDDSYLLNSDSEAD